MYEHLLRLPREHLVTMETILNLNVLISFLFFIELCQIMQNCISHVMLSKVLATFPESLIIMFYFQDLENAVFEYFIKMHVSHPITSS